MAAFFALPACGGARFTEVAPLSSAPEAVSMHAARVDACAKTRDGALDTAPSREGVYEDWRACVAAANDDIAPWIQANAMMRGYHADLFGAYRAADAICQDALDSIPDSKNALHWDWAQQLKGIRGIDSMAACRGKRESILASLVDATLDMARTTDAAQADVANGWSLAVATKSLSGNISVAKARDEDDVTKIVTGHVAAVLDGGSVACRGLTRVRPDFSNETEEAEADRCAARVADQTAALLRSYDLSQVLLPSDVAAKSK
jgi:hypothetical protein